MGGRKMHDLLDALAKEKKVDSSLARSIIRIEKNHVYQKSRHTRGSIKELIVKYVTKGGECDDH